MLANQLLVPTPLFEMEQLTRDKQREYQALYVPITFEGVPILVPAVGGGLRRFMSGLEGAIRDAAGIEHTATTARCIAAGLFAKLLKLAQ